LFTLNSSAFLLPEGPSFLKGQKRSKKPFRKINNPHPTHHSLALMPYGWQHGPVAHPPPFSCLPALPKDVID